MLGRGGAGVVGGSAMGATSSGASCGVRARGREGEVTMQCPICHLVQLMVSRRGD